MPNYFKTKIRYQQPVDDATVGTRNQEFMRQKTVSETRLFDAVSFTDAEARLFQEVAANTPDFEVTHIERYKLADVFRHDTGDDWYLVKADFITDDEKTGKQKRNKSQMLVNASSNDEANSRIREALKRALDPFEITHVDKTDILEVVDYTAD